MIRHSLCIPHFHQSIPLNSIPYRGTQRPNSETQWKTRITLAFTSSGGGATSKFKQTPPSKVLMENQQNWGLHQWTKVKEHLKQKTKHMTENISIIWFKRWSIRLSSNHITIHPCNFSNPSLSYRNQWPIQKMLDLLYIGWIKDKVKPQNRWSCRIICLYIYTWDILPHDLQLNVHYMNKIALYFLKSLSITLPIRATT